MARCTVPAYPEGIDCSAELFLSKDMVHKDATSGVRHFVSAGETTLALEVTMPQGGYWYADIGGAIWMIYKRQY